MAVRIFDCRKVAYRFFIGFLAAVILFTGAFQPRAKAGVVGTVAVVAGVAGALAFSAAWLAYARANGVDLSVYSMLSGQDLVDAITDLVQQYLNDERDGISANTYFDSVGIPSIVKFAYNTVGSYLTGGVKAIISASGISTVFEPFTDWFIGKFGVSSSPSLISSSSSVLTIPFNSVYNSFFTNVSNGLVLVSPSDSVCFKGDETHISTSSLSSGYTKSVYTLYNSRYGTADLVAFSTSLRIALVFSSGSNWNVQYIQFYGGELSSSVYSDSYFSTGSGLNGYIVFCAVRNGIRLGNITSQGFLDFSSPVIPWSAFPAFDSVRASQSADNGTNRYPSTSVPSGKQLEVPIEIPNVTTDYPVVSDTEEQRSNDIANAIIAGQIGNDFAVDYTGIEINEEKAITPTVTMPPTLTPTPIEMPSPEEPSETATPTAFPIVTIPPDCPDCPSVGWLTPWPVSPDQFAVITSDGRTALVDITDTIKGWTESLTGIYQSYVDLLGSVFGFLPDEIQVLFKWSMAALIFTGIFKRWWWDHH